MSNFIVILTKKIIKKIGNLPVFFYVNKVTSHNNFAKVFESVWKYLRVLKVCETVYKKEKSKIDQF